MIINKAAVALAFTALSDACFAYSDCMPDYKSQVLDSDKEQLLTQDKVVSDIPLVKYWKIIDRKIVYIGEDGSLYKQELVKAPSMTDQEKPQIAGHSRKIERRETGHNLPPEDQMK